MNNTEHFIDGIGIGTKYSHLSDLRNIGFVYKLIELGQKGIVKMSETPGKSTIPYSKEVHMGKFENKIY